VSSGGNPQKNAFTGAQARLPRSRTSFPKISAVSKRAVLPGGGREKKSGTFLRVVRISLWASRDGFSSLQRRRDPIASAVASIEEVATKGRRGKRTTQTLE